MTKITFAGDIMCEPLMLKAAKQSNGSYDFTRVFDHVKDMFSKSDYVVGNLETPLAGKKAGFVHELFSFNAPDEFAAALKAAGFDFVSTANNHCMDRGTEGLLATIKTLNKYGLAHSGTYPDNQEEHNPFIVNLNDIKIAIIPCTYGTNYRSHHRMLRNENMVDLLHSEKEPIYIPGKKTISKRIKSILFKPLKEEQIAAIKKGLGLTYNRARSDDYLNTDHTAPYFIRLKRRIERAREDADIVIVYPHVAGQFNIEPGLFSKYTVKKSIEYGADAVIASHPHIVQKAEPEQTGFAFYSLGNFSMSPNSVYLLHENLPEYGLAVHLYIEDKKIIRVTFSILKIIEKKNEILTVWPTDLLYRRLDSEKKDKLKEDIRQIYKVITGDYPEGELLCREYDISNKLL